MRAAVLSKPGKIQVVELPEPAPGRAELKIQVFRVGICGSDLARYEGRIPQMKAIVFGHEFSGRVAEMGEGVSGFSLGQPVTVAPLLNCGQCSYCQQDKGYLCAERMRFGTDVAGALQEFVCVPSDRVYPLPDQLPLEYGAMAEPLAVALHAIRQAGEINQANVVILGGGAVGLLIAVALNKMNVHHITVLDILPDRVALAKQMGFQGALLKIGDDPIQFRQQKELRGFDFLFEASGSSKAAGYFLPLIANLGTIVVVGRIEKAVEINLDAMLMMESRLVTSRYFSLADFNQAVEMIATSAAQLAPLIQQTMDFTAFEQNDGQMVMQAARRSIRLMIRLGDE